MCRVFCDLPGQNMFFYGGKINEKFSFFDIPLDSEALLIYGAKKELSNPKLHPIEQIACKLFCSPYLGSFDDSEAEEESPLLDFVFVPLWHTLK